MAENEKMSKAEKLGKNAKYGESIRDWKNCENIILKIIKKKTFEILFAMAHIIYSSSNHCFHS